MYRYIYKITCTCSDPKWRNKYYYGRHTTKYLNNSYTGSGKYIKEYISLYPNDYVKEIIAFYDSNEELNKAEYDIIHPCLNDPLCLNTKEGGYISDDAIRKRAEKRVGYIWSEEKRKQISDKLKGVKHNAERVKNNSLAQTGKQESDETRQKKALDTHNRRWMCKDGKRIYPNKDKCDYYLSLGYHFGMK